MMMLKFIRNAALVMALAVIAIAAVGCGKNGGDFVESSFSSLIDELGDIESVKQGEADLVYTVTSADEIGKIEKIIADAISNQESFTDTESIELYEGAPKDAAWLVFAGKDGASMDVYVNDAKMKYDLVCCLHRLPSETEWYCYDLSGSIYKDIQKITHAGEMTDLNNQ
ncbi:MAG: hypothetical protein J6X08_02225 [Lachnospiraceae bacterium]|nr:hypothetical protein [Lachnospiraceae bacterium]